MFRRQSKVIAAMVVCFFTWTSGGVFTLANAAQLEAKKPNAAPAQRQRKAVSPEERFARITDELESTLADTKADIGSKKNRLKIGRDELNKLDVEMRKQFAATEQRLKAAKLPAVILERHHRFVKHYDDNLNELKGNIALVEKAKDEGETEAGFRRVHEHLKRVKAPSGHQKLDPNNLPYRQRVLQKREPRMKKEEFEKDLKKDLKNPKPYLVASAGTLSGLLAPSGVDAVTLPTADDLSETIDVQFTPEIRAKALELGNSPVKIYEWVRNNFAYEPYYGSLKGAQQTLLEMAGNDFDLDNLLIALLRVSNVPARYVYGTVDIPIDRFMNWLGVVDPVTAGAIAATNGIPVTLMKTSNGVYKVARIEHAWVEAFVEMLPSFGTKNKQGNTWTPMDPNFKEYKITAKTNLSKEVKFNETAYLSKQSNISPSLSYLFSLEDYNTANPRENILDIFYAKKIIEEEFSILPGTLPYQVITIAPKVSEIPDALRHKISFYFVDTASGTSVSIQKNIAEVTGNRITISYDPARQEDETTINSYGGLLMTPAYLVKVKPTVRVQDDIVLEGPEILLGSSVKLEVGFLSPGFGIETIETDIANGIFYNIGLSALANTADQLSDGLDTLQNLAGTIFKSVNSRDGQIGKFLHNIALHYFANVNGASKALESIMHIQNTKVVSAGFFSVKCSYSNIFGEVSSPPTISVLNMDIQRYINSPVSITGDMDQRKEYAQIQGLNSSFYEHGVMQISTEVESISAVKALQIASETGIPIYTIDDSNFNSILPLLNVSYEVKLDIQNAITAGKQVIVSRDNINIKDWSGVGYIVRDPKTGAGAYMISKGLAGTDTTEPASLIQLLLIFYS